MQYENVFISSSYSRKEILSKLSLLNNKYPEYSSSQLMITYWQKLVTHSAHHSSKFSPKDDRIRLHIFLNHGIGT